MRGMFHVRARSTLKPAFQVADETFASPQKACYHYAPMNPTLARFWFWYYRDPTAVARLRSF